MDHSPESPWQQEKQPIRVEFCISRTGIAYGIMAFYILNIFFILIIEIPIIILPINIRQNDQKELILTILVG